MILAYLYGLYLTLGISSLTLCMMCRKDDDDDDDDEYEYEVEDEDDIELETYSDISLP